MALKPVFQIEIDDSRFKAFKTVFDRYRQEVAKLPSEWGKLNEGIAESKSLMERLADLAERQSNAAEQSAQTAKEHSKITLAAVGAWTAISTQVSNVNHNITQATASLVRWSTLTTAFAGLLGAGSLFGLDRLANSVASQRRQAMGSGVSYGSRASFMTNAGQVLSNPGSLLSGAFNAKYDYTGDSSTAFNNFGVSRQFMNAHDPAEMSRELLRHLDEKFADIKGPGHEGEIGARAKSMHIESTGLSLDDLIKYLTVTGKEKADLEKKIIGDNDKMNVSEAAQKAWADLVTTLDSAGKEIDSVFMTRMAALAPAIEKLSASLVNAVKMLDESGTFKEWFDALGGKIEEFAAWIDGPEFKEAEKGYLTLLREAAAGLSSFVAWVSKYAPAEPAWVTAGDSPDNLPGAASGGARAAGGGSRAIGVGEGGGTLPRASRGGAAGHAFPPNHDTAGPAPVGGVISKAQWLVGRMQQDFGLTRDQATGAVGWMLGETAGTLSPSIVRPGGTDTGWAQWVGTRRQELLARGPLSDETNYAQMKSELERHPAWLQHLRSAEDVDSATWIWGHDFEGAGGTPGGMEGNYRAHLPHSHRIQQSFQSAGRLPAVRIRGNTGANPFTSTFQTSNPTSPPQ